jgi:hypothetical protein
MPTGSKEHRENIRKALTGKKYKPMSQEGKENIRNAHLGKKYKPMSVEGKENIRRAKLGIKNPNWKGGLQDILCLTCKTIFKVKPIASMSAKFCSKLCYGIWNSKIRKGIYNPNYKEGKTPINLQIRNSIENKNWKRQVFRRDNYTCVFCGLKGGWNKRLGRRIVLNAHHILLFTIFISMRFNVNNGVTFQV